MKRLLLTLLSALIVLFATLCAEGAITSLNLFETNDFNTCTSDTPDKMIRINDNANCHLLVAEQPELELEALYYITYSDFFVGSKSSETYDFKALAILDRCDCEHIRSRSGKQQYNQSCFVARLYQPCDSFKYNRRTKYYWNKLYNNSNLEFWGVDVDYLQDFMLY